MPVDPKKRMEEIQESQRELEASSQQIRDLDAKEKEYATLELKRQSISTHLKECEEELGGFLTDDQRKNLEANAALYREEIKKLEAQIKTVEKEIADLNAVLSRNKHFDKYLLFSNIRELMKGTEVKLGQIEKEAGCQPGYMSRLDKTDSATDPTAEFIITASQMLKVSVDVLLNVRISELTPSERYIISFLEKLIRDTIADKLTWGRETEYDLNHVPFDGEGEAQHRLFVNRPTMEIDQSTGYPNEIPHVVFPSRTYGDDTFIAEDCFNIGLKNGTVLYVMSVMASDALPFGDEDHAKEIWMAQPGHAATCLCSTADHKIISDLISSLYAAISQNIKHPKVAKNYQYIINSFMNDDLSDDPVSTDELPF